MLPGEEHQLVPREFENAAEEPRVLCIVQDTTNSKTVTERITLNLPASTSLKQLFKDVSCKARYVNGTFDLAWGNGVRVADMAALDQRSDKSLIDVGFAAGKKNFLHLMDRDGEQPQQMMDDSGANDSGGLGDGSQERFIGPLPREGSVGCVGDYATPNYSYSSIISKSDTVTVHVDKRITLAAFKQQMEPFVGVSASQFKVFRVYATNQEFESVRLNESLSSFSDDNKITIRLGRALKKGEYRVKVFQLLFNEPEPCKFLLDAVFAKGMTVRKSKEELQPQLREHCGLDLNIDRFRLRKKTWKNPGTVFLDYHVYEDEISLSGNLEVFLEILDEPEKMKSMSQLSVLTRRWRPSQMQLDPFREVLLESSSTDELKEKLHEISGISFENIEFAKGRGTFPCDISLLEINQDLDWNPKVSTLNVWPLYICDDGAVIYFRDKTEELIELTDEQRSELLRKEGSRLQKTAQRVTYSPRKEKALKIYLDGAPNKDFTQE